ncbi:hypothetical protein ACVIOG_001530 [Rhizobium leguminosarum]
MSGIEVITFGCRLNTYESEVMKAQAEKAGLNNAVLVNTLCRDRRGGAPGPPGDPPGPA